MRTLSSSIPCYIPPPERELSWKPQLSKSDSTLHWGEAPELGWANAQLRARDDEKRNHSVVQRLLNEAGNNTIFTPIAMSACGAMGPSMAAFLKGVYGQAKRVEKSLMLHVTTASLETLTWNVRVASLFWDTRLSIP